VRVSTLESGGRIPSRRGQRRFLGRIPWRCGDFTAFFPKKKYVFYAYFGQNFCWKTCFL